MSIYVDPLVLYQGRRWCHMMTDGDLTELHHFAEQIGLQRRWFQRDERHPHYDLTPGKRLLAVQAGAIEVHAIDMLRRCAPRQYPWPPAPGA